MRRFSPPITTPWAKAARAAAAGSSFTSFVGIPVEVLEMGSSDWIVHPAGDGYPRDEAFFLEFILTTIEDAVRGRVEEPALRTWVSERRRQLLSAELVYCAHQVDVLARRSR